MMASELIEALQAAIDAHEDHPVAVKEHVIGGGYRMVTDLTLEPQMTEPAGGQPTVRVFCL